VQKPERIPDQFREGDIADVIVRDLRKFRDDRGWLSELFRTDDLPSQFVPAMAYISSSRPGITRGPHEHIDQADFFCFLGPSTFKLRMWDNREASPTYRHVMTLIAGESEPKAVIIPQGIVHAYQNVGEVDGIVINCPNRLYMGEDRCQEIDEVRHEDDPDTIFRMD
jgi:dTDP-4-dehydrorhamnose 3,5-epimerase